MSDDAVPDLSLRRDVNRWSGPVVVGNRRESRDQAREDWFLLRSDLNATVRLVVEISAEFPSALATA